VLKIILSLLFFLFSISGSANENTALKYDQMINSFNSGEFTKSLVINSELIADAKVECSKNCPIELLGRLYNNKANILAKLTRFKESDSYSIHAISLAKELTKHDEVYLYEYFKYQIDRADILKLSGNIDAANRIRALLIEEIKMQLDKSKEPLLINLLVASHKSLKMGCKLVESDLCTAQSDSDFIRYKERFKKYITK